MQCRVASSLLRCFAYLGFSSGVCHFSCLSCVPQISRDWIEVKEHGYFPASAMPMVARSSYESAFLRKCRVNIRRCCRSNTSCSLTSLQTTGSACSLSIDARKLCFRSIFNAAFDFHFATLRLDDQCQHWNAHDLCQWAFSIIIIIVKILRTFPQSRILQLCVKQARLLMLQEQLQNDQGFVVVPSQLSLQSKCPDSRP